MSKQPPRHLEELIQNARRYDHPSVDRAAVKDGNMNDIMHYNYMRDYVRMREDQDRATFLDSQIHAVKPIFKNFMDNNTNILRTEIVMGRLKSLKERESQEAEIQKTLLNQTFIDPQDGKKTIRYRCFDPEGVGRTKPMRAVESLLNQTKPEIMSKTAGVGGFGLKKTAYDSSDQTRSAAKSSHLLEKIRRN